MEVVDRDGGVMGKSRGSTMPRHSSAMVRPERLQGPGAARLFAGAGRLAVVQEEEGRVVDWWHLWWRSGEVRERSVRVCGGLGGWWDGEREKYGVID
jgi:hypothetical protein